MANAYPIYKVTIKKRNARVEATIPYGKLFRLEVTFPNGKMYHALIDVTLLSEAAMCALEVQHESEGKPPRAALLSIRYTSPDAPYMTIDDNVMVYISIVEEDTELYLED